MKTIVSTLLLFGLVACQHPHKYLSKDIHNMEYVALNNDQKLSPVVRFHVFSKEVSKFNNDNFNLFHLVNNEGYCSAWIVDSTHAFTAAHCTVGLIVDKSTLIDSTGQVEVGITDYQGDSRTDYAILTGDFSQFNAIQTVIQDAVTIDLIGQPAELCGYPGGSPELTCTRAVLKGPFNSQMLAVGELYPGMSGGPVMIQSLLGPMAVALNTATIGEMYGFPAMALILSPLLGINGL